MINALAIARLVKFGYLAANARINDQNLWEAIQQYARFFRLVQGVDSVTETSSVKAVEAHILKPRCGCPDIRAAGATPCKWPIRRLKILRFTTGLKLPKAKVSAAVDTALDLWEKASGLRLELTDDVQAAHIVMRAGRIDGPGKVLAQSELPCGATSSTSLNQLYDSGEDWESYGEGMLLNVILHEFGHALGLEHSSDRDDVMYAIADALKTTLRPGDIARTRALYPEHAPPPPVIPADLEFILARPLPAGTYRAMLTPKP